MTTAMLRRSCAAAALACAALAGACDSPTIPPRAVAYRFAFDGFAEPVIYRWPVGQTIGVYVLPAEDPDDTALLERALAHTAVVWNDAVLYGEYRIRPAALEDADVLIAWANQTLPLDVSDCPPLPFGSAWTTFCADSAGEAIGAYALTAGEHSRDGVHMIVQLLRNQAGTQELVNGLIGHEFGHVLGIGTHPCRLADTGCSRRDGAHSSIMHAGIPDRSTPSAADRATVELLYHTRPDLTP